MHSPSDGNPPTHPERRPGDIRELSQILIMGEGDLYLSRVRRCLEGLVPEELSQYLLAADQYLLKSVVYYLRLFRRSESIRRLVQHPGFSIPALERIVLYLHYNFLVHELPIEDIFTEHFPLLSQAQYLELLLHGEHAGRDRRISMNLIARLDREHLERFVREREGAIHFLGEMLKDFPPDLLASVLRRNPDLFGYLKLFFEYGAGADPEVQKILARHENEVLETMRALKIAKRLEERSDAAPGAAPGAKYEADRIVEILRELKAAGDPERALETLASRNVFADEGERQIVKNILLNPHFRDVLDEIPPLSSEELQDLSDEDLLLF